MQKKYLFPLAIAAIGGLIFFARGGTEPLKASVAHELPDYGFPDVDLDALSAKQLGRLKDILHSGHSAARIKGDISVVLAEVKPKETE